ncbi:MULTISPECIES: DUF6777 domain-containing protein [unclassified Kitasatospora]|uniref:DUF6777 domain-containing protein n=1 Tax=unclassified Kitasatospora TaxID=2633591 RepID=UPI0033F39351
MATVLIVNNQGSHTEAVPAANEVALQAPADPGPDPFTPSVETQGMTASAPATSAAAQQPGGATSHPGGATSHPGGATSKSSSPAALHSIEGSSAGLYAGTMGKSSCDTERLIGMVSAGDTGRAWASAVGIAQADIPGYLRSLTPTYLRVDARVTNHNYKSGAVVEYQSALQAGTAVLVDSQGVPRVRCACGNPLKPPKLVSNAKYTGKAWAGFQPTTLIVVVPAPQPVTEIILVNVETGGWFSRLTGRIEIVDKPVEPPKGPLVPGVPPPGPWTPSTPSGTATTSTNGATTSGPTTSGSTTSGSTTSGSTTSGSTTSGSTTSGSTTSGSTTSSGGPSSSSATSSTSSGTPSETKATSSTSSSTTTGTTTSAGSTTSTSKPTVTSTSAASTTTVPKTPAATCATTPSSTLPPCPSTLTATPS